MMICNTCPVIDACLDSTLDHEAGWAKNSRYGLFGGKTPSQRYAMDEHQRAAEVAS